MFKYCNQPIRSLESLSLALSTDLKLLKKFSYNQQKYYWETRRKIKPDGSVRITYDTNAVLKKIHKKMKTVFFDNVDYPDYLQGALKGRDYISNCTSHSGHKIIIKEDVSAFFDNIQRQSVFNMWKYFFHFSDEVSSCLADITTRNGTVPQGSVTSSYIANLIFWEDEPKLFSWAKENNITYTRFVDDISLSSKDFMSKELQRECIRRVIAMLKKHSLNPNRKKQIIKSSKKGMKLHKLNIISDRPSIPKWKRAEIRSLVKQTEMMFLEANGTAEYRTFYNSVSGKVNHMGRIHPIPAKKLKDRLELISPI